MIILFHQIMSAITSGNKRYPATWTAFGHSAQIARTRRLPGWCAILLRTVGSLGRATSGTVKRYAKCAPSSHSLAARLHFA